MKKRLLAITITATLAVAALPTTIFQAQGAGLTASASALTLDEAKQKAASLLPEGSKFIKSEVDDGLYELKYYHSSNHTKYKIKISTTTGEMKKIETQLDVKQTPVTNKAVLKEKDLKTIITAEIKDALILSTNLSTDDGVQEYEVYFKTATLYGCYEINAQTGVVLEREIKAGNAYNTLDTKNYISINALTNKALSIVPSGTVTDVDIKTKNGQPAFKVEVQKDGVEHKLYINALTGELITHSSHPENWGEQNYTLDWDYDDYIPFPLLPGKVSSNMISSDKAVSIAMAKAPKAKLVEIKLDYDDGQAIYEGKLIEGNTEYEFEIDALTGKVIDWEVDTDD